MTDEKLENKIKEFVIDLTEEETEILQEHNYFKDGEAGFSSNERYSALKSTNSQDGFNYKDIPGWNNAIDAIRL